MTVKKIEAQHLPPVDESLAKALGIGGGTVEALRADVRKNLEREVKFRVQAQQGERDGSARQVGRARGAEVARRRRGRAHGRADARRPEEARHEDADSAQIPVEMFQAQAERRVRLGLVVAELVRSQNLQAKPEQLQAHIEELSQSYEKPNEVMRWYLSDRNRMAEVEAIVVENNVANFVLELAKATEKEVPFDELMAG